MKQMDMQKAIQLIKRYKVNFPDFKIVKSAKDAVKAAETIGFPVAMKIVSKDIIHKTDSGGIKIGIESAEDVEKGFEAITSSAKKKKAKIDGVMVQKMEEGAEIIVGVKNDPQFGPVVMFGIGGIFVEILEDVSFRVAPIEEEDALEMIDELKGKEILEGARGGVKANIKDIAKLLVGVSKLAMNKREIEELDLNPVIVNAEKAVAVDVRVMSNA